MTEQEMAHVLEICVNPSGNCAKCPFVRELDCCSHLAKETKEYIGKLKAENTALRSAVQYLIDDGAADCCAKCVYCPQPTEEDDDCDCQHKGECVDGMTVDRVVEGETGGLEGRKAHCTWCGRVTNSRWNLPFFAHSTKSDTDSYYCGCGGLD